MSSSNSCFLTCIQISQEAGQVVWYSHLFKNFPQFVMIHITSVSHGQNQAFSRPVLPPGAVGGIYSLFVPAAGNCQHSLACGHIPLISVFVFTWPLPLLSVIKTFLTGFRSPRIVESNLIVRALIYSHLQRSVF